MNFNKKKKLVIRMFLILTALFVFAVIITFYADYKTTSYSEKCYSTTKTIPKNRVGLVLGTIKYLKNNHLNYYYKYRIEAAVKLYKSGKIEYILVSGDNSRKSYDEPSEFKNDLIKRGIPENKIFLDYAGFRTFDSIIRSKEIFGQTSITIISQKFHNERALFIADKYDIDAIAYNAKDVSRRYGLKVMLREKFARVKTLLDLYILPTKPKFLGEKIVIK